MLLVLASVRAQEALALCGSKIGGFANGDPAGCFCKRAADNSTYCKADFGIVTTALGGSGMTFTGRVGGAGGVFDDERGTDAVGDFSTRVAMCTVHTTGFRKSHDNACDEVNDTVVGFCDPNQVNVQCCGVDGCESCQSYAQCSTFAPTKMASTTSSVTTNSTVSQTITTEELPVVLILTVIIIVQVIVLVVAVVFVVIAIKRERAKGPIERSNDVECATSNEPDHVSTVVVANNQSRLGEVTKQQQKADCEMPIGDEAPRRLQYASVLSAQAKEKNRNHYEDIGAL